MDHGALYYVLLATTVIVFPAIVEHLLKGRVADRLRFIAGFLTAALAAALFILIHRRL